MIETYPTDESRPSFQPFSTRHRAILEVDANLLVEMGKTMPPGRHICFTTERGLPPDARLIGTRWDQFRGVLELLVESDDLPDVLVGCEPPRITPVQTAVEHGDSE